MRFEVKGGGIAAIVFAITVSSGAVFVLGLLAGYDVGRQAQLDTAQLATSFPLQSEPSSSPPSNPSPTDSNPAIQSAALNTAPPAVNTPATPAASPDHALAEDAAGTKAATPSRLTATPARQRLASSGAALKAPSGAATPAAKEDDGTGEDENLSGDGSSGATTNPELQDKRRVASTAGSARHKPYNIEIQAAMDISGADQMMARLQKLGYPSHLVPTEIAGQRWYKVEVGPYATTAEASNAEAQLRQRYDTVYGGAARENYPARESAADNSEE
jgi:hypothetical protein